MSAPRSVAAGVTLVVLLAAQPAHSSAQTGVDVVVDVEELEFDSVGGGHYTTSVGMVNLLDQDVSLSALTSNPACTITTAPTELAVGPASTTVTFEVSGCDVSDGIEVVLTFGAPADNPSTVSLPATVAEEPADWWVLWSSMAVAFGLALVVVAAVGGRIWRFNKNLELADSKERKSWDERDAELCRVIKEAYSVRYQKEPILEPASPEKIGPSDELDGLGTDWSFKDNWVSSVTVGSAALVALLASSDVLSSILGREPKAAIGVLAVSGAVGAVLVALGPIIIKVIGDRLDTPTVAGALVAGFVTVVGTLTQAAALTLQAAALTWDAPAFALLTVIAGAMVVGLVMAYATVSLYRTVRSGTESPQPAGASNEVRSAWVVARALHPEDSRTHLTPLEVEEILHRHADRIDTGDAVSAEQKAVAERLRGEAAGSLRRGYRSELQRQAVGAANPLL
jgi:hypothetical protein